MIAKIGYEFAFASRAKGGRARWKPPAWPGLGRCGPWGAGAAEDNGLIFQKVDGFGKRAETIG